MEKLIELLNEYDSWWAYDDYYWLFQYWQDRDAYRLCKYQLVSKEYGFIKWLVDNDKIDLNEYPQIREYSEYESLLMYLSIQDEPIEFLISILK